MSAWGTGLLENDIALDARLSYDEVLASGGSIDSAVASVLEEWDDEPDEDGRADLILALAWMTAERGAVPAWLAAEARDVIRQETALRLWEETVHYVERQQVERLLLSILDGTTPHPGRTPGLRPEDADCPEG